MNVQIVSDLHLDRGTEIPEHDPEPDVVILAGDAAPYKPGLARRLAQRWEGATHVIYVPGNEEFFGSDIDEARVRLADACSEAGITLLDRDMVRIRGIRFIGATLWTDLLLAGLANCDRTQRLLGRFAPDFQGKISHGKRFFTMGESVRRHEADRTFIERELKQADRTGETAVVITHHALSPVSMPSWRRTDAIGSLYASKFDDVIERHRPRLWIHGSPYGPVDERLEATRLVAAPATRVVGCIRGDPSHCLDIEPSEMSVAQMSLPWSEVMAA